MFVGSLEGVKDELLALPPSQGQVLSNEELFASICEDARRSMLVKYPTSLTDSEDDDSESSSNLWRLWT